MVFPARPDLGGSKIGCFQRVPTWGSQNRGFQRVPNELFIKVQVLGGGVVHTAFQRVPNWGAFQRVPTWGCIPARPNLGSFPARPNLASRMSVYEYSVVLCEFV